MTHGEIELKELLEELQKSGMNPMVCNTLVPYFDAGVHAGLPIELEESTDGKYYLLPQELVGNKPYIMIPVCGNSMIESGLEDGDIVQMQLGVEIYDGDVVLVSIDEKHTLKAYCEDEDGIRWLVPRNDEFRPIRLNQDMKVRVFGKVTGIMKKTPHASYNEMMRSINRERARTGIREKRLTPERLREIIISLGDVVKHGRQWYAVYRAMVDKEVLPEGDYSDFVDKIVSLLPFHKHLPVASELKRMAVQSFRKPVALWDRNDAPVSGQRFDDYLRIANLTTEKMKR